MVRQKVRAQFIFFTTQTNKQNKNKNKNKETSK